MTLEADALIVGAGPAGTCSAIFLAEAGYEVALIDQARFPRPKACGEGVMPAGLPLLRELGLLSGVEAEGRRFRGVRFSTPRGISAEGRFPKERFGIVIARERLDLLLLEKAKASRKITVVEGLRLIGVAKRDERARVVQVRRVDGPAPGPVMEIKARWILGADGAVSATANALGIRRKLPARRRFGLRAHFDNVQGLGELVEVFLMPGFEIYVAPHARTGRALIALLIDAPRMAAFEGRTEEAFLEALASCGPLRERTRNAVRQTPIMGLGPLGGSSERWQGAGWILVGDAASSLDPITGEGIAVALANGRLAAGQISAALRQNGRTAGFYTWKRRWLMARKLALEGFMLGVSSRPGLSDSVLAALARRGGLFTALLSDC